MSSFIQLLKQIVHYRSMIWTLALRDLEVRYAGTIGGTLWALVHPLALVVIFYFVFVVGFRAQGPANTPFILWFVCGLVPWFFFSETLTAITGSITSNTHLVKKTIFPTETLPFVHLVSGVFPHAVFLLILVGMLVFFGIPLVIEHVAFVYFFVCSCILLLGLGWLFAALQVFYRDISQGLTIILSLWFWITPIVWSPDIMPPEYRSLLFFNPIYYIVEGYRGVLIFESITWPDAAATAYFWSVTTLCFLAGSYTFRRLKPEFPDVM